MSRSTTVLCILDGLGLNPKREGNAVAQANKPILDKLFNTCPHTTLTTHGCMVGLPEGQMGNSEVGHLNIGAGRIVDQWLQLIGKALSTESFVKGPEFTNFITQSKNSNFIHLVGLLSDGGVHSHEQHLYDLIKILLKHSASKIGLHLLMDGRDTSPTSGINSLEQLQKEFKGENRVEILSLQGRFFGMDRDNRWERVEQGYHAITGTGKICSTTPNQHLNSSYANNITDEFIEPVCFKNNFWSENDSLVFWNFRADRMRELVQALALKEFTHFNRSVGIPSKDRIICFTEYSREFQLPFLFAQTELKNYLGQAVANANLKQLRTAETEKYPHVTYFLNGGSEVVLPGEHREMVASPRDVKTYDLKPEMSAYGVKDIVVKALKENSYDLIVVNFANCDMVGHTGNLTATIKAVETVDTCLGEILSTADTVKAKVLIIADHGNAEQLINYEDGTPHTAHTTHPVPCILYGIQDVNLRNAGALCDVAPTILELMGIAKPKEMTGNSLLERRL